MRGGGPLRLWLLATLGGAVFLGVLHRVSFDADSGPVLCLFRSATGIPCPGCGLTRACLALVRGDWQTALHFHPLAPLFALQAALAWLLWGRWAAAGAPVRLHAEPILLVLLMDAALLIALWLGRLSCGTLPG